MSTSTSAPRRGSSRATTGATRASSACCSATSPPCRGSTGRRPTGVARPTCRRSPGGHGSRRRRAKLALLNIARGISDPELRAKVTPDYAIGCKRILISNTYYPALARDDVELVTDPIAKVTGNAVVTADGVERPVDVIVVATGFHTTEQPIAERIHGRGGRTLAQEWADGGMASYKGTTTHGFPNLFQLVGANTGLGHSSMVFIIESQIAYVLDAIATMKVNRYATVEPRRDVQDAWNRDLQRRMARTVWSTGGCASWYLDAHGRNTTLWPRPTFTFRSLLSRFDVDAYDVEAARSDERIPDVLNRDTASPLPQRRCATRSS